MVILPGQFQFQPVIPQQILHADLRLGLLPCVKRTLQILQDRRRFLRKIAPHRGAPLRALGLARAFFLGQSRVVRIDRIAPKEPQAAVERSGIHAGPEIRPCARDGFLWASVSKRGALRMLRVLPRAVRIRSGGFGCPGSPETPAMLPGQLAVGGPAEAELDSLCRGHIAEQRCFCNGGVPHRVLYAAGHRGSSRQRQQQSQQRDRSWSPHPYSPLFPIPSCFLKNLHII